MPAPDAARDACPAPRRHLAAVLEELPAEGGGHDRGAEHRGRRMGQPDHAQRAAGEQGGPEPVTVPHHFRATQHQQGQPRHGHERRDHVASDHRADDGGAGDEQRGEQSGHAHRVQPTPAGGEIGGESGGHRRQGDGEILHPADRQTMRRQDVEQGAQMHIIGSGAQRMDVAIEAETALSDEDREHPLAQLGEHVGQLQRVVLGIAGADNLEPQVRPDGGQGGREHKTRAQQLPPPPPAARGAQQPAGHQQGHDRPGGDRGTKDEDRRHRVSASPGSGSRAGPLAGGESLGAVDDELRPGAHFLVNPADVLPENADTDELHAAHEEDEDHDRRIADGKGKPASFIPR